MSRDDRRTHSRGIASPDGCPLRSATVAKMQVHYQPGPQSGCSTGTARWSRCGRRECGSPGRFPGTRRGPVSRGECGVRNGRRPDSRAGEAIGPSARLRRCCHRTRRDLAEGADFASVMAWIADHDGQPEATVAASSTHGLHRSRLTNAGTEQRATPLRYVLPAGTLT